MMIFVRKKALTSPVTKYELVWILLNFNQKRGYFQLRDENGEDDNTGKTVEYFSLRISDIIADTEEKSTKGSWYTIVLENGWSFRRTFDQQPDWIGKTKDFIVTTEIDKNGLPVKDKDGKHIPLKTSDDLYALLVDNYRSSHPDAEV